MRGRLRWILAAVATAVAVTAVVFTVLRNSGSDTKADQPPPEVPGVTPLTHAPRGCPAISSALATTKSSLPLSELRPNQRDNVNVTGAATCGWLARNTKTVETLNLHEDVKDSIGDAHAAATYWLQNISGHKETGFGDASGNTDYHLEAPSHRLSGLGDEAFTAPEQGKVRFAPGTDPTGGMYYDVSGTFALMRIKNIVITLNLAGTSRPNPRGRTEDEVKGDQFSATETRQVVIGLLKAIEAKESTQ